MRLRDGIVIGALLIAGGILSTSPASAMLTSNGIALNGIALHGSAVLGTSAIGNDLTVRSIVLPAGK